MSKKLFFLLVLTLVIQTSLFAQTAPVANAATNITQTSFTANWTPTTASPSFFLMVALDANFINIVPGYNNLNVGGGNSFAVTSNLSPNTTYYYEVGVQTLVGPIVYSNVISVTTLALVPLAPVAAAATNIEQTSFQANWNASINADGYYLDVSANNGFSSFIGGYNNINVGNVLTSQVTGLSPNTIYYYRLRAYNTNGTSGNSNAVDVTTLAIAPVAPVATAATNIQKSSFNANWNAATDADGYYLDVSTSNVFSSFFSGYNNVDVGNVSTYQIAGLSPNTAYYYRLRAYNTGGTSGNSNTINVTTLAIIPFVPFATAATNIQQTSFNANWRTAIGADGYYLDVSTSNLFSSFISGYNNVDVANVSTYPITGLLPNTTYYYRLRAYNTGGTSGNSNTIMVTTLVEVPFAPVAVAATNIKQTSFNANWNTSTNADGYYLDVSTSNIFSSFISGYNNLDVGNVLTFQVAGLSANTIYYYRLRAYNAGGTSGNSNIVNVTTLAITPSAPVATAATNIQQTSFIANWSAVTGAAGYYLDVSISNLFSSFIAGYNNKDVGNVSTYPVTGLSPATTYYYRLRAYNASGTSGNSNIIQVISLVSVDDKNKLDQYFISQNFPNPFNPGTNIGFTLPEESKVVIEIYNAIGQKVDVLLNSNLPAGYQIVKWNAQKSNSGIYFCRITAHSNHSEKKFIKTIKMNLIQ